MTEREVSKVLLMTREYPPHVYGGAGVHVEHLAAELAKLVRVEVRCFGEQSSDEASLHVRGQPFGNGMFDDNPSRAKPALDALLTCLRFNAAPLEADVVHCHTWYAHWGGVLAKLAYGMPLVVTVHSLEPLRPWKREQLGRGYDLSSWIERTTLEMADAVIAVSQPGRSEILELFNVDPQRVVVVPNGVDTRVYRRVEPGPTLAEHGIDPARPFVLFLGRVSRQKGILHFLRAAEQLSAEVQVVLCAASPDSPEIEREVEAAVTELQTRRAGVIWIRRMIPRRQAIELYSSAALFCCPSVYEPFGLINLEAMACETPVVATAVGGIPEILTEQTGVLVGFEPLADGSGEPRDPQRLAGDLATAMHGLLENEEARRRMGRQARERAVSQFGWDRIAKQTLEVYRAARGR